MNSTAKLALAAILTTSAAAAAQTTTVATPIHLDNMRAFVFIDTINRFYPVPTVADGQYSQQFTLDKVDCELPALAGALPTCRVTAAGKVLTAPTLQSLSPSSNLYQLISELGGAHADATRPGVIVAAATAVNCSFGGHGPAENHCTLLPAAGAVLPAQPVPVSSTSRLAGAVSAVLGGAGVPEQSTRQYESILKADQIQCTAALREYANDAEISCTITAAQKTYTVTDAGRITLYRLIAESGGAHYDAATNAYIATVTQVTCANYNTHEESPTTCTYVVADRHPVLTRKSPIFITDQADAFYNALKASHPAVGTINTPGDLVSLSLMDCTNSSLTSDPSYGLACVVKAGDQVVTASNRWDTYTLYSAATDALRLDTGLLSATQMHADYVGCYLYEGHPVNCQIDADKVFPL